MTEHSNYELIKLALNVINTAFTTLLVKEQLYRLKFHLYYHCVYGVNTSHGINFTFRMHYFPFF